MTSTARVSHRIAGALFLATLAVGPGAAKASPDTIRMAFANLLEGPVDMVLAPVVAGRTLVHNAGEVGAEPVGPVAYVALGSVGMTALQVGWGALRTVSGALMLLPGIVLFPFEGVDLPPEVDVFGQGDALVEADNPLAEDPAWVKWTPPTTPATVDATIGIEVPYSRYPETGSVGSGPTYPENLPQ